jgi:hypothetical protein
VEIIVSPVEYFFIDGIARVLGDQLFGSRFQSNGMFIFQAVAGFAGNL